DLDERAARDAVSRATRETGLPATDPVRFDPAPVVDAMIAAADRKRRSPGGRHQGVAASLVCIGGRARRRATSAFSVFDASVEGARFATTSRPNDSSTPLLEAVLWPTSAPVANSSPLPPSAHCSRSCPAIAGPCRPLPFRREWKLRRPVVS